jgi:hypothetical protein
MMVMALAKSVAEGRGRLIKQIAKRSSPCSQVLNSSLWLSKAAMSRLSAAIAANGYLTTVIAQSVSPDRALHQISPRYREPPQQRLIPLASLAFGRAALQLKKEYDEVATSGENRDRYQHKNDKSIFFAHRIFLRIRS